MRAALLLAALAAAAPAPAPAAAGPVLFSGLARCPAESALVFTARDSLFLRPDSLWCAPARGELRWTGGPVRGLAFGGGDTVYAAVLLGVSVLAGGGPVAFLPWARVPDGRLSVDPAAWPPVRAGAVRPEAPALPVPGAQVLPERYYPLAGGNLLFLVDAEHPPRGRTFLYDLHARGPDGVELLLVRNLEPRLWVLHSDSLRWALAARVHRADYGGEVREVVAAGIGARVATFDVGRPRLMGWSGSGELWILLQDGDLMRLVPGPQAWRTDRVRPAAFHPGCAPAGAESLWVWMGPGRYRERDAALREAGGVRRGLGTGGGVAWVIEQPRGAYRPVWGGYLDRESLLGAMAESPVPGGVLARVGTGGGQVAATVAKVRLAEAGGVAAIHNVTRGGAAASELWWRFLSRPEWVRLAGPWGLGSARPAGPGLLPSVDTPPNAP